jgi:hypothetical protein
MLDRTLACCGKKEHMPDIVHYWSFIPGWILVVFFAGIFTMGYWFLRLR